MFNITRKEILWGGRPLILETGKIARQADGAVREVEVQELEREVGEVRDRQTANREVILAKREELKTDAAYVKADSKARLDAEKELTGLRADIAGVVEAGVPVKVMLELPLLTPAEVASMFRVDPKTVTRWANAGRRLRPPTSADRAGASPRRPRPSRCWGGP
jgi:hypothetical protein